MAVYAELDGDLISNITVCDDPQHATAMGWVDIDGQIPMPAIGWSTSDGGQTFTAPPPEPLLPPPVVSPQQQEQAVANVQQLAASLPAQITQAQADATTLSGLVAGQALTAEQVAALQRAQQGWTQLLPALQSLVTAAGLAPPPA